MSDQLTIIRILTQTFVHRNIQRSLISFSLENNYRCIDDWINLVYKGDYFLPAKEHFCSNLGGEPRYRINKKHTSSQLKTQTSAYNDFIKLRQEIKELHEDRVNCLIEYLYKDTGGASAHISSIYLR